MRKEKFDYFDKFIEMTEYIVESGNILKELIDDYNEEKRENSIIEVHRLENKADRIVHDTRKNLIKDFLPPIEREDIAVICKRLDNIEDGIDEVLINFKLLNIDKINKDVVLLIDILVKCCRAVNDMFLNLRKFKDTELIDQKAIQISKLETSGDEVYEKLVTSLYKNEKDSIYIIKWSNIYKCLEETIDICEAVSDAILDIVMKNS